MLDPHRARTGELQRVHIHGLQIGGFERLGRYRWCALNQLSGNALRFPLDLFRTGKQCGLAFEQLLDPRA